MYLISIDGKTSMSFFLMLILVPIGYAVDSVYGQDSFSGSQPIINDPSLKADLVFQGLRNPTSMAFLGPNDVLVLEKDQGTVQRIVNGSMLPQPALHVTVATEGERGMLGIAIAKHTATNGTTAKFVYLYYTNGGSHLGNHVYQYELVGNKLINPKLILNLLASPGPIHDGGKVNIGPDKNVYVVIGDLRNHRTQSQNIASGGPPDLTSGIIRVTQDGKPVLNGPLGNLYPLNLYYAYGIRNSFGMDFDPVTGKLWDTENGPNYGDEINLVEPGFNSGWAQVQGIWTPKGEIENENAGPLNLHPSNLVDFDGKRKYRAPEFIWFQTVAPTALKFLDSAKLGKQYQNEMFVGDYNNGNLYHFKLNQNRTALVLGSTLANKIAYTTEDTKPLIFGTGFDGGITDLQVGPDGYLYVLTFAGEIYRIAPVTSG
ncbi:MAG: PQQ-dependent sugar dehydrogenase [Candidatus Nitrosopolaris sp.]